MSISLQGQLRQRSGKMQWVMISKLGITRARLTHSLKNFQTNANALTKKPRWFPPTSTVGEKVWKVNSSLFRSFNASLYAGRLKYACLTNSTRQQWGMHDHMLSMLQILNTRRPAMHYVITPNWWYNWFAPKYLPGKLVTKEVARKFGLNK